MLFHNRQLKGGARKAGAAFFMAQDCEDNRRNLPEKEFPFHPRPYRLYIKKSLFVPEVTKSPPLKPGGSKEKKCLGLLCLRQLPYGLLTIHH